jgi:hypothetical protein
MLCLKFFAESKAKIFPSDINLGYGMKTIIIIPTYNEGNNITLLILALQVQFRGMQHDMHILVVDDYSQMELPGKLRNYN